MNRQNYYSILLFCLFACFSSQLKAQSCDFIPGMSQQARVQCGLLEVPENHDNKAGRKIEIAYVVLKAKNEQSTAHPLIYFSGGPGGASIHPMIAQGRAQSSINQDHDIIMFDQRGIGYSSGLPNMEADFFSLMSQNADEAKEQSLMNDLIKKYKKMCDDEGIGLEHYNTFQNARDVGALMDHLGYEKYNISGGSYGTRLARVVQDMFPEKVNCSLLNSPNPLGDDFLIDRMESYSLALSRIFDYCEGSEDCKKKYPNLKEEYIAAIKKLKQKPIIAKVKGEDFYVNAQDAVYLLRRLLYGNASREKAPELIMAYKTGNTAPIEAVLANEILFTNFYNSSMWLSVERYEAFHEENTPKKIAAVYKKMELLPARLGIFTSAYTATMNHWHQSVLPVSERDFKQSAVPSLIMVNQYDPVTPPENGHIFQKHLSNSYLYILDEGGHGGGNEDCREKVMLEFMENPKKEPNTSCLNLYKE
ncbi:MAG: alpha/beta fold hydrolase [Bacteroidia bacterium]|nr:alpha/beta fold hydrolase [Bacteroidia bacterium]